MLELEMAVKADIESSLEGGKTPELAAKFNDISREVGGTLVNLCSMYSSMGKHEIALKFAYQANSTLELVFLTVAS